MTEADGSQPTVPGRTPAESPAPASSAATEPLPGPASASAGAASSERPADSPDPAAPPAPERETIIDAVADLLQMVVNWIRQEAAGVMRDKVVLPLQQVGLTVASAMAAAALVVIGLSFLFVALLLVLAAWLGWPGALTLVGVVILIGAGVFTYVKMRSIQS